MDKLKHYAVVGHPVKHSLSPTIHARFARQAGISLSYKALDVSLNSFSAMITDFFEHGDGLNITSPLKQKAFELADVLTTEALAAGAVNTLKSESNGRLYGYNTDGIGLISDLTKNLRQNLTGKRILIIGAGGAVLGAIKPLMDEMPELITVVNRTKEKAIKLVEHFISQGNICVGDLRKTHSPYDLVINGTSATFHGSLPPIPKGCIGAQTVAYDMVYGCAAQNFISTALSYGAAAAYDGLGMLVEQAAEAFNIWHNFRPNTQKVISYLRKSL